MTVNVQVPYADLEGNGTLTTFPFSFGVVETSDIIVLVDGVLQIESSTYTIENLTETGGEVEFTSAPDSGDRVLILRRTTITQQADYTEAPFPSETHEDVLDKITYILQELIGGAFGGIDSDGNPVYLSFDLSVTQNTATVTINNTGGTDADIPLWISGTLAGVYRGYLVDQSAVPADEAATAEPDGTIWLGVDL